MSVSQKAVLVSLADQANDDGVCWPSVRSISTRTCLSERAVQDALAWLQTVGAVFRNYRANTSTSYNVTPSRYDVSKAPAARIRAVKAPGANGAPGANSAPPADGASPSANGAPGGADGAPPEVQTAHPNHQVNRQLTVIESLQPGKRAAADAVDGVETERQAACRATWAAYSEAFERRYGSLPVRNKAVNSKVKAFVERIGAAEAPAVAAFYVDRVSDAFIVRKVHDFGQLLSGAEGYRTQWAAGAAMTGTRAHQIDQTQSNYDAAGEAMAILRQRRAGGQA